MLPGGICVSFNNSHERAAKDFHKFMMQYPSGTGYGEVVRFFEQSSKDTNNDYIIAFSKPPKLVRIVDGKNDRSLSNTLWIGDQIAYERFREYEAKFRKGYESGRAMNAVMFFDPDKTPTSDLYSTMRHVVLDTDIPSVGGFVTSVALRDEGFRHSTYSDVLYDWPEGENENFAIKLTDKIDFGVSGENEEVSISQISTGYIGLNIVAFYMLRAKKAFVFHWHNSPIANRCIVISDVEPQDLKGRLGQLWPQNLRWLIRINSAPTQSTTRRREPFLANFTKGEDGIQIPIVALANTLDDKFEGVDQEIAFIMPFENPL